MGMTVSSTSGVSLAVHDLGGSGPPLLFSHATGFHGRAYRPLTDRLAEHYDVWAFDYRAHGASTPPEDGDFAWDSMADDLLAVVDHLGVSGCVAVAHSMGAASVLLAELKRPGTFRRAFLYEPIVFSQETIDARTENPLAGPTRRRKPEFESRAAAIERFGSRPPFNVLHPDALASYVEYGFVDLPDGTVRLACEPEHEASTYDSEDEVIVDRMIGLELPCVIAAGGSAGIGDVSPGELSPPVAAVMPNAELIRWDDLGHFGPMEDPERIAEAALAAFSESS